MPLYEYECTNGHRVEVIQKFSDPPLQVCATCGAPTHKLQASPAFQFKGSGWYITDYGKKDSGESKSKDSSTSSEKSDASSPKTETKKEAASESGSKAESPAPAAKPS